LPAFSLAAPARVGEAGKELKGRVCESRFEEVTDPVEKRGALQAFIDGLYPGRWDTLRPISEKELNACSVLRIPLTEASAKVRNWGVKDDDDDLDWPVWAGVIPFDSSVGTPRIETNSVVRKVPPTRFSPQE
jgi:hypothetical protein